MKEMRCPRCQSENGIVQIGRLVYCRDCISFGRLEMGSYQPLHQSVHFQDEVGYCLGYDLSEAQDRISKGIVQAIRQKQHVMIQAVCGSGKTELVYASILEKLSCHQTVCFALPRRDLVIEMTERLSRQFHGVELVSVYGGHHEQCYAPLVICTTHQLYRYPAFFDLLIIDEADAFPFYGQKQLMAIAANACKGQLIIMSATLDRPDPKTGFAVFELNRRYHGHRLDVPQVQKWLYYSLWRDLRLFLHQGKQALIFVPTKAIGNQLARYLKWWGLKCELVHSQSARRDAIIAAFKARQFSFLICTTLLERGMTFEDVQVIVFQADHPVFDTSTLIQICGRVGRKPLHPHGKIYFLAHRKTREMKGCMTHIQQKNA